MPPKPGPPPRQVSRSRIMRRRLGALGAVIVAALVVVGLVKVAGGGNSAAPPPTATTIAAPKPFRIIFPEGFTREDMAHRVVQVVAKIAESKRHKHVRLSKSGYLAWTQPRVIAGFGSKKRNLEGFLFPATYDFLTGTTSAQLVQEQLDAFRVNWKRVDLSTARKKNLTPYDVLTIASMVERETLAPDERPLVAAVIYNRLHAGMTLGIDATIRYGLHVPARRRCASRSSRATTRTTRGSSPACRRRRSATRGSPRCRRPRIPRRCDISTSSGSRTRCTTTSPRATRTSSTTRSPYGYK